MQNQCYGRNRHGRCTAIALGVCVCVCGGGGGALRMYCILIRHVPRERPPIFNPKFPFRCKSFSQMPRSPRSRPSPFLVATAEYISAVPETIIFKFLSAQAVTSYTLQSIAAHDQPEFPARRPSMGNACAFFIISIVTETLPPKKKKKKIYLFQESQFQRIQY